MSDVLVYAGSKSGTITKSGLEALGAGRRLADELGVRLVAVVIGVDTASPANQAVSAGAEQVLAVENPILAEFQPDLYVAALEAAVAQAQPAVFLITADAVGRELGPRLSGRLGAGVVAEVTGFQVKDGKIHWSRPVYGGKAIAVYTSNSKQQVICLRPRLHDPAELDSSRQGEIVKMALNVDESVAASRIIEKIQEAVAGVKLEDARIIVAGGRGLGGKEPFKDLEALAKVLGGSIGASRAACDAGWVSPTWQVGQTGTIVAPDIYIAIGISGASQHLAGIAGAKTVIAVNSDPDAPIFKRASLGIVADFKTVLPTLTEQITKALQ